jgi:anti-sigma factor RsiW
MSSRLTCKQLVTLVSDYLDGRLSPDERERFDMHIGGCGDCAAYLDQLRQAVRLVGKLREEDIEPSTRDALLTAFRAWKARPA